ncbi:YadA-like family protein [Paraburkholderia aromaticivorans]|uniref:YadA-like family protein n=1 Tax=Paraburkholderia aromaticivorans TaxID=2026199 RepID=UPI0038B810FC
MTNLKIKIITLSVALAVISTSAMAAGSDPNNVYLSTQTDPVGSVYIGNGNNDNDVSNGSGTVDIGTGNTTASPSTNGTNLSIGTLNTVTEGSIGIGRDVTSSNGGLAIGNNTNANGPGTNINATGLTANSGDVLIGNGAATVGGMAAGLGLTSGQILIQANSVTDGPNAHPGPSIVMTPSAVTFNSGNNTGVVLSNVLPGTANTDAVDVGQLNAAIAGVDAGICATCVTYTDGTKSAVDLGNAVVHNMANGLVASDGMNLGQGQALATALGGGAAFNSLTGTLVAPSYPFTTGQTFNNVGSALANLDARVAANTSAISTLQTTAGTPGATGATGPQGPAGQNATGGNGTDALAVHYTDGSKTSVDVGGAGIHNLATGTARTDAANTGQVQDAQAAAESYTNTVANQTLTSANNYTNQQVSGFQNQLNTQQNEINGLQGQISGLKDRINSVGAAAMAESTLVPLTNQPGTTQLAAGYGEYGGQSAVAVGAFHVAASGNAIYNLKVAVATNGPVAVGVGATWVIKNLGF